MSFKKFRKFYANPGNPFDARPVAVFLELSKNWSMQVQFPAIGANQSKKPSSLNLVTTSDWSVSCQAIQPQAFTFLRATLVQVYKLWYGEGKKWHHE